MSPREERFPTFGAAFTPPEGWENEPTQPLLGFLGRWLPAEAPAGDWSQFTVEMRPIQGQQTARQAAAVFERRGYTRTSTRLGGMVAERLDAPPPAEGVEPRAMPSPVVIARRGDRLWRLLFLFNSPEEAIGVDEVIGSWRWLPMEPVADHLSLGEPQPIFDGVGTMRLPAVARVDPTLSGQGAAAYTSFDYKAAQDAIIIVFYLVPAKENDAISAQVVLYAEHIEETSRLGGLLDFVPVGGRSDLYGSEVLRGEFEVEGQKVNRYSQYAVWQPRTDLFVRMQAVVNDEVFDGEEQIGAALQAVANSIMSCSARQAPMAKEAEAAPSEDAAAQ